jgi:Uma2 family endonuclease
MISTRCSLDVAEPAGTMGTMGSTSGVTLAEHYAAGEDLGRRRELVDGVLIVSPFASVRHALAVQRLNQLLCAVCPPDLLVLGTINVDREPATNLQPDVVVIRSAELDLPATRLRPLLVVEVLSPTTRRFDETLKRRLYAEMGIPSYWLVDIEEPSLTVLELERDDYRTAHRLVGETSVRIERPFAVTLAAADLTR